MSNVSIFLLQALFIVVVPPFLAHALRLRSVLPLVVVQILLGIALGPSVLGHFAPDFHAFFFNRVTLDTLSSIASVAVLFFAFTTGMHVEFAMLRGKGSALGFVSLLSMLLPTALGTVAGAWIVLARPELSAGSVGAFEFVLGVGICCGVTALPVLASIVGEMKLFGERLGQYALAVAAINDGSVWILLGVLLALAKVSGVAGGGPWFAPLALVLYVGGMFAVVRPLFRTLARHAFDDEHSADAALIATCGVAIGSAAVTELLGLHFVLGAFVAGVITPTSLRKAVLARVQPLTTYVLIPFFFISTGLKTHIDVTSPAFAEVTCVIAALAIVGKVGGVAVAARLTGESWRFAFALGALAQTKGLMEVVIATILLDAHVLPPAVFSSVILMAVVSTALAMPLTRLTLMRRAPASARVDSLTPVSRQ